MADEVGPARGRSSLQPDRKSTRLNSSHPSISYAVFWLKRKREEPIDYGVGNDGVRIISSAMGWCDVVGPCCVRAGSLSSSLWSAYWSGLLSGGWRTIDAQMESTKTDPTSSVALFMTISVHGLAVGPVLSTRPTRRLGMASVAEAVMPHSPSADVIQSLCHCSVANRFLHSFPTRRSSD